MKWVYRWLKKKYEQNLETAIPEPVTISGRGNFIDRNGMNFTVYRADGGHVIETRTYDRKTDRTDHSLHIVTDDKDLGEEIGKIITYENLRR